MISTFIPKGYVPMFTLWFYRHSRVHLDSINVRSKGIPSYGQSWCVRSILGLIQNQASLAFVPKESVLIDISTLFDVDRQSYNQLAFQKDPFL